MNNQLCVQWVASSSATSATATATEGAPNTSATMKRHLIYGFTFSAIGVPTTSATLSILDGATVLDKIEISVASSAMPFRPIIFDYAKPLPCTAGNSAGLSVTTLGPDVIGTVFLRGRTESR